MRVRLLLSPALAVTALVSGSARPVPAQIGVSLSVISGVPCGTSFMAHWIPGPGGPTATYTATMRSTYEQRLVDGNIIRQTRETTSARDANGRTMQQNAQSCDATDNGENGSQSQVTVNDPKARTTVTWIVGMRSTHVAYLRHNPEVRTDIHPMRPPQLEYLPKRLTVRNEQSSEQLGSRNIAGVEAKGVRWTRIIPAGAEGNDLPIKVVRESWTTQNRLELMALEDDPRTGHHMWEITALSFSEPDPSLFAPPQDYKVDEGTPMERREVGGTHGSSGAVVTSTSTSALGSITPPR